MIDPPPGGDPRPVPLSAQEEVTWRALIRLMVILPRAIDDDLQHRGGITLTRYVALMRLAEAPGEALRMSSLAEAVALSPSRLTRVVQGMTADGLLVRAPDPTDARASVVSLTVEGRRVLEEAWPAHLAGVRELVLDHVTAHDLPHLGRIVTALLRAIDAAAE